MNEYRVALGDRTFGAVFPNHSATTSYINYLFAVRMKVRVASSISRQPDNAHRETESRQALKRIRRISSL